MFPLRDINPTESRAVVTHMLIGMNACAGLLELSLGLGYIVVLRKFGFTAEIGESLDTFVDQWGLVPSRLMAAVFHASSDPTVWFTPVTHMFLHGGWMHFIGNMWFLKIFGDNVEDAMGHGRFLVFYLLAGVAAGAAQLVIDPSSAIPMVGASGAIAGVLGAYILFHPRARVLTLIPIFFVVELPAWVFIFVWFAFQLFSGAASLDTIGQEEGGVAFFAHIGGFVAGLALAPILKRRRAPKRLRTRRRQAARSWEP